MIKIKRIIEGKITFSKIFTILLSFFICNSQVLASEVYTEVKDVEGLKKAVEASENIKLTGSFELTETIKLKEQNIILDLNGYTITGKDNNTSGNFNLFDSFKSNFTIKDSKGTGKITLIATTDRDWNAMSTIVDSRTGQLTIEGGTLHHLGGSDMAYVINVNSNSYGSSTLTVEDGNLNSTYTAIRLYMSKAGTTYVNINGGTITGITSAIWAQAPESNGLQQGEIKITDGNIGIINTARGDIAKVNTLISGGTIKGLKFEQGDLKITGGTITDFLTVLDSSSNPVSSDKIITAGIFGFAPTNYIDNASITAILTKEDNSKLYAVGETCVKELAGDAESGDELRVDGDIELYEVSIGVSLKATKDSKVIANGITVTEEGITINSLVDVDVKVEEIEALDKVIQPTVGIINSSNVTNVFIDSLNKMLSSELNQKLKEEILDKSVKVDLGINKVKKEDIDEKIVKSIMDKVGKGTITDFFEISVNIKDSKNDKIYGNISELSKEIELGVALPEKLKNNDKSIKRNYFIIRRHVTEDGVEIEKIKANLFEDGKMITFKTDKFSTYALGYEDVKNPNTYDGILTYITVSVISLMSLILLVVYNKNKKIFN